MSDTCLPAEARHPGVRAIGAFLVRACAAVGRIPEGWLVAALLTVFTVLACASLVRDSITLDETSHLPAGLTYLDRADFRLNPEHPPAAKMWAALPLWISGAVIPDYTTRSWTSADQWQFGSLLLNGPAGGVDEGRAHRLVVLGRLPMVLIGAALGLVIYRWARETGDRWGALVSLFFFALSPTMLAHTRLVTTDVPAAFGFALTLWLFSRFCENPRPFPAVGVGLSLGVAIAFKHSMLLLVPLLGLLSLIWIARPSPSIRRTLRARYALLGFGAWIACAGVVLWSFYGFRYSISPEGSYSPDWGSVRSGSPVFERLLLTARECRLLPEGFLHGLAYIVHHSARPVFLNGVIHEGGVWYYFPEAFLLKSTPATLTALLLAAAGMRWHREAWRMSDLILVVAFAVYMGVAVGFGLNIGHRHLAVLYPLLFVFLGSLWNRMRGLDWRPACLAAILGSHALSAGLTTPQYLPYYNVLAGGSSQGWKYLVDSNIDWGQDLIRLREWLTRNNVPTVYLAYFGSADPRAYGISYRKVSLSMQTDESSHDPQSGDTVAVSVTLLQGLHPGSRSEAELYRFLRTRLEPVGRAGASIFIYRIP